MLLKSASHREWVPTDYAGIERSILRLNATQGRTSLVRLKTGARFPTHAHHGHEDILVLAGSVSVGGTVMQTGDYLLTEPGEEHDVVALEDAIIYVSSDKATPIIQR